MARKQIGRIRKTYRLTRPMTELARKVIENDIKRMERGEKKHGTRTS